MARCSMVGTAPAGTSSVSAVCAEMVTVPGYVFQKRETVRFKLGWPLAIHGGGTLGCQTPNQGKKGVSLNIQ